MATTRPDTNSIVAHLKGVKAEVRDEGQAIAARARALRGQHRDTGAVKIRVEREDTDYLVHMVDDSKRGSAVAIEFGGIRTKGRKTPQAIQGLFILTRAAGLPGR